MRCQHQPGTATRSERERGRHDEDHKYLFLIDKLCEAKECDWLCCTTSLPTSPIAAIICAHLYKFLFDFHHFEIVLRARACASVRSRVISERIKYKLICITLSSPIPNPPHQRADNEPSDTFSEKKKSIFLQFCRRLLWNSEMVFRIYFTHMWCLHFVLVSWQKN